MTRPAVRSPFRRSVMTLLGGQAAALAVSYLAQPVLTRLYTPDAFGGLDVFVSLMGVLVPFASLRYEDAVMLPEDDDDAAGLLGLAAVLVVLTAALTAVAALFRGTVASWFGAPLLAPWLLLVPPVLLAMRLGRLSEVWLARRQRFAAVSGGQVTRTTVTTGTRLLAGVGGAGLGGLVGGLLAGHAAACAWLGAHALRGSTRTLRRAFRRAHLRRLAIRYRRFPLFSTPSTLLNALVSNLPVLVLAWFFDERIVGFYGRAFVLLAVPLSLVGGAVAQVFFVEAAQARRAGTLAPLTAAVYARLAALGLFPTAVVVIAGPDVAETLFGAAWRTSGVFLQYVAPWFWLMTLASPLTNLFDVLERQGLDLATSVAMFAGQTAALLVGGWTGDVTLTLLLLGVVGAGLRMVHLGVLLRLADVSLPDALRPPARYALLALPGIAGVAAARLLAASPVVVTVVAVAGGGLYLLLLWRRGEVRLR